MAILEEEIEITLNQSTTGYFEEKGYKIPRYKDKYGTPRVKKGTKIIVMVNDLSENSRYKVTKVCDDCGKKIPNQPYGRVIRGRGNVDGKDRCGSCVQKHMKRTYENSLENWAKENNKEYLIKEYSFKNELNPTEIAYATNEDCFWTCNICKSEYVTKVNNRTVGDCDCPYCSGQKVNHTNCLWTTHPEVAKLLINSKIGFNVTSGSGKKASFVCPNCNFICNNKIIKDVVKNGTRCPLCSDGISYNEKFVAHLLFQLGLEFKSQVTFEWSGNKRYDFYVPVKNCIIEVHGYQHYLKQTFEFLGGKTLEEEQENDRLKENLAIQNNIDNYIVIDCRFSDMKWIRDDILNSNLPELFNIENVDWMKCHEHATNSLVKVVCDLWNKTKKPINEISDIVNLDTTTIRRYFKIGSKLNWCDYGEIKEFLKENRVRKSTQCVEIIQLSKHGEFIKEWSSINEAARELNIQSSGITMACKGRLKQSGGFQWRYKK